jgi:hypothetical protein
MTAKFKAGDKDYIRKLNEMDASYNDALAAVGGITDASALAESSATLAGQHKDAAEAAALAAGTSEANSANSATLAGQHKDAAAASALAAGTSETNSANSATLAGQHKDAAAASALAAGTSEANSANSATLAGQHKDAAEAAALAAGTSEANSANSATLAGQHKDAAEAAALAAGTSEANSANSATLAGEHKDAAEAAALAAGDSETNSANSATLAGQHKDAAEAAALAAGTSESNSANSATLAGEHKDAAAASALAAGTSETNSADSATLAGQHKDAAAASALAAGTSETNSADSATLAGEHKDAAEAAALAAGTSETNSAASATLAGQHKDLSQLWAESDTEIEAGKYSAKHWADQAAQVVTGGLLDDGTVSGTTTWSSTKISNELGQKAQANDPRLSDAREWSAETVTQAEAEEGSSTTRRAWTAQRVRQAITAVVGVVGNATQAVRGWMSPEDKTKLDGIAAEATANSSDAELRDRSTHTGTQGISTVAGLQAALSAKANTTDLGTASTKNVAASGDAAAGEVVLGSDSRLSDARTPTTHSHDDLYYTKAEVGDIATELEMQEGTATDVKRMSPALVKVAAEQFGRTEEELLGFIRFFTKHDVEYYFQDHFNESFNESFIFGSVFCSVSSVSSTSIVKFSGTVGGASIGDVVLTQPSADLGSTAAHTSRLTYFARVSAPNTIEVTLANTTTTTATLNSAVQTVWPILIIKNRNQ